MFQVQHGAALYTHLAGAAVVSVILFFALTLVPTKLRRPLIMAVTFAAGLFYALEFFWPVSGPELPHIVYQAILRHHHRVTVLRFGPGCVFPRLDTHA